MASAPVAGALDAHTQAFPVLTAAQIERIRRFGKVRQVASGETLFEAGESDIPFFVLLTGRLGIFQTHLNGEQLLVEHGPGSFTGEINMISGRRVMARGRVTEPGEFVELNANEFRSLIAKDAELSELIMRAFILRRQELIRGSYGLLTLLGSRHSARTLELREFLTRSAFPYSYVDLDKDQEAQGLLDRFAVKVEDVPVVICPKHAPLRNPTVQHLADCLGFNANIDSAHLWDVVIVGAGPAGLAAAVYAASEGLDALVVEAGPAGGQAGSSSKIENYLGFPTGISGMELADRAMTQAEKFGAKLMLAHGVERLECTLPLYHLILDNGTRVPAKTIVISTGAQYNKLQIPNLGKFEGQGVYYGATYMEAQLCEDEDVVVVGGGNSAGQAAVFLSQTAHKVYMLVRSGQLSDAMSRYLIQRIEENPGIELHYHTEASGIEGGTHVERVTCLDKKTGETSTRDIRHVFIMAGAAPRTDWLKGCVALDSKGFILTGRDLENANGGAHWPLQRAPQMLETSLPGVFAVGDVRAGNVKRVASAVGEGSIAIHLVHRVLAEN